MLIFQKCTRGYTFFSEQTNQPKGSQPAEDPGASPAGFMQISAIATMAAVEHPNEHGVSQTH